MKVCASCKSYDAPTKMCTDPRPAFLWPDQSYAESCRVYTPKIEKTTEVLTEGACMTDIETTLADRQKTHGSFAVHAQTTQLLKATIASKLTESGVWLSDEHQEALDMIFHKIGRIVAGNPNHTDHWHDIAGYATLGEKACTKTSI